MNSSVIDVNDIQSSRYVRFEKTTPSTNRSESSILLNVVPEHVQRALERQYPNTADYIVNLNNPTVVGSNSVVWLSDNIFAPTTIDKDWKNPESLKPQGAIEPSVGAVQLITQRWGENYFHWTYQSLAGLLDMLDAGLSVDRLVVTPLNAWRRRTLELAGVDPGGCIEIRPEANVCFDSALYSSFLSRRSVNRPTQRLINLFDKFSNDICTPEHYKGSEKIYVSRVDAKRRRIENEGDICHLVSQYGFEVVQTEKLDVDEQINLFSGVRHVVAPHGAGLVNLLYAQRCISMTEILQAGDFNQCMFRICQAKGIPHYSLQAQCAKEGVDWRVVSKVDLNLLESHLDALSSNGL